MGGRTQKRIVARIIAGVLLFGAVLYAPHWTIVALMGIVCVFSFPNFYEILAAAFLIDVLYGGPLGWMWGFAYPFTLSALILLFAVDALKTQLRFNVFQD